MSAVNFCMAFYCAMLWNFPGEVYSQVAATTVCSGGRQELLCETNRTLLSWTVLYVTNRPSETRYISSVATAPSRASITVNGTVILFLRTLASPLVSTMLINNVPADLNQTRVDCHSEGILLSSTVIHVIRNATPGPVTVYPGKNKLETDQVSIIFEWFQENNVLYSVSVVPEPLVALRFVTSTSVEVTLSYNIYYNLSITSSICEYNSTNTTALHYAKCVHIWLPFSHEYLSVEPDYSPALEGSTVSFNCNNSILSGPNTSTCMENGQWKPDPRRVKCKADCKAPVVNSNIVSTDYTSTLEDSIVTLKCKEGYQPNTLTAICFHNGTWIPDPADYTCTATTGNIYSIIITAMPSLATLLLSSVVFFIVGYLCGCCRHKQLKRSESYQYETSNPDYAVVLPISTTKDQQQEFKLEDNVVYGHM